ncbi:RNA polymerase II-associated [Cantharellus anzutake]|uniref:RNA polymerase II-associated n=1 Tax=Cantharellus anzutake TaxID=1750568 RepID=UPI0019074B56|nr:RNA polymerase II-associated [Cantharellus anzutake]KAF8317776.1 RNA polymerase II-associated [Cantharellus anzutake]
MTSKKSKLDLLVRVRYSNPLPPPPFPPKLINVPTHPSRYARFDYTSKLADETPFPMIVDAELGMPIDLSKFDELWDFDDITPLEEPKSLPDLDPKDAFLVSDLPMSFTNGNIASVPGAASTTNVSWLRRTEYISSIPSTRASSAYEPKPHEEPLPDVSHATQIADIEASFRNASISSDLSTLRHPSKPHLRAVDTFEVLPDTRLWANAYDLVRFSERPGERPIDQPDPRLDSAIIRPTIGEDGESFLSYYLTKDDTEAAQFMSARRQSEGGAEELFGDEEDAEKVNEPIATFQFVRDYETIKIETDVPNEFLLTTESGATGRGAFYKNIERKYVLKKKRQNRNEEYSDKWDIVRLRHVPFTAEQLQERAEAQAEVDDPSYLANLAAADVDGDAEADEDVKPTASMDLDGELAGTDAGADTQGIKDERKPEIEQSADAEMKNVDVQEQMRDEVFGGESDSEEEDQDYQR